MVLCLTESVGTHSQHDCRLCFAAILCRFVDCFSFVVAGIGVLLVPQQFLAHVSTIAIAFKLLAAALVELAVQDRGQFMAALAHCGSEGGSLRFVQCRTGDAQHRSSLGEVFLHMV